MVPVADVTELMRPQLEKAWDDGIEKGKKEGEKKSHSPNSQALKGRRSRHGTHHQDHRPERRRDPETQTGTNLPH